MGGGAVPSTEVIPESRAWSWERPWEERKNNRPPHHRRRSLLVSLDIAEFVRDRMTVLFLPNGVATESAL
jgi:hypothetical protein